MSLLSNRRSSRSNRSRIARKSRSWWAGSRSRSRSIWIRPLPILLGFLSLLIKKYYSALFQNVFKQIPSIQFLRILDVCPLNDIQVGLIRNFFKGFIIMCFNLAFNFILWLSKIQFTMIIRHFRDDGEITQTRKDIKFESNLP